MLPAAGRAVSSPFPRRCAAFSFLPVCTTPSFRPLDTAPELRDNKKLRIDKCKAGVWNVGFPYAGADAGKHTAPLQTQKRVNGAQPQPRLRATRRAMFQPFLRFYVDEVMSVINQISAPFRPFLRFWSPWRGSSTGAVSSRTFQPFLRFYRFVMCSFEYGGHVISFNPS